ncbi:retroviral-like aspartic protease family protein [Chitinibacter sp. SCUT-21]|uniref:retropepsin-like aspartic protease family protein n=1 Tax=Chitinibacter sp. SCUT-21 TaxID=2970891 RepID=UPI0035A6B40E
MKSTASIVLIWLLVAGAIYWAFDALILRQHNPNVASMSQTHGEILKLKRSKDGHFRLSAMLNQQAVVLMIDTGASSLTIDESLAQQLSLERGEAFVTQTANGPSPAYWSNIEQLQFGPFELENIKVAVVPRLGDEALLGMNVLKFFAVQISGNEMTLQSSSNRH